MNLECVCGKRFRSYTAEARHRHNFPSMCRRPKLSSVQDKTYKIFLANPNASYCAKDLGVYKKTLEALARAGKITSNRDGKQTVLGYYMLNL